MAMMETSLTVDWLSISYKWEDVSQGAKGTDYTSLVVLVGWLALSSEFALDKPRYGFTSAVKWKDGVTLYLSPVGSEQGLHVVYPGASLTPARAKSVLGHAARLKGYATRIDITVDMRGGSTTVLDYQALYLAGKYTGYPRTWKLLSGSDGCTLYIGSRASEKYLRIYDKAAETGDTSVSWVRVELECKRDFAKAVQTMLNTDGFTVIPLIIDAFVSYDTDEWKHAMKEAGKSASIKGTKKLTDTRAWLLNIVAPMLARLNSDNPGLYAEFMDELSNLIDAGKTD